MAVANDLPVAALPSERRWRDALFAAALSLCVVLFLLQLSFFARPGATVFLTNVGQHAYVFAWMFALTAFGRTLSLRVLASRSHQE